MGILIVALLEIDGIGKGALLARCFAGEYILRDSRRGQGAKK